MADTSSDTAKVAALRRRSSTSGLLRPCLAEQLQASERLGSIGIVDRCPWTYRWCSCQPASIQNRGGRPSTLVQRGLATVSTKQGTFRSRFLPAPVAWGLALCAARVAT